MPRWLQELLTTGALESAQLLAVGVPADPPVERLAVIETFVDPLGELLATGSQGETILFADIEPATVAAVRDRFRFLPDRR